MMTRSQALPLTPVLTAMVTGAAVMGAIGWRMHLQGLDQRIQHAQSSLKKLVLTHEVPPNQDVMDYLTSRQHVLEQQYHRWITAIAAPPMPESTAANPQLYFQERVHDVQQSLERLAATRSMPVPEQLGLPKELPPPETVPRLLVQLTLMQEMTALAVEQGIPVITSFKIEDPQTVPQEEGTAIFLTRLPVRMRCRCSLPQLMKLLAAVDRTSPFMEIRQLRVLSMEEDPDHLDVEFMLARYLINETLTQITAEATEQTSAATPSTHPEPRTKRAAGDGVSSGKMHR